MVSKFQCSIIFNFVTVFLLVEMFGYQYWLQADVSLQLTDMHYDVALTKRSARSNKIGIAKYFPDNILKKAMEAHQHEKEAKAIAQDIKEVPCNKGYFKIGSMKKCRTWLQCKEILPLLAKANLENKLGRGLSKLVHRIPWSNKSKIDFALSVTFPIKKEQLKTWVANRMKLGMENLIALQPSKHVIQMAGYCEQGNLTTFITEYCKYGTMSIFVASEKFRTLSASKRLDLVIQIIERIVFLHYENGEPKVHCDLHNPSQSLRQFLVTDEMKVVLNDVDEILVHDPKNNKTAKCEAEERCEMSDPEFMAPEQRYTQQECRKSGRHREASLKADVWKIPDISNAILNDTLVDDKMQKDVHSINIRLNYIHKKCKIVNVSERTDSRWVLRQYVKVYNNIINEGMIHQPL